MESKNPSSEGTVRRDVTFTTEMVEKAKVQDAFMTNDIDPKSKENKPVLKGDRLNGLRVVDLVIRRPRLLCEKAKDEQPGKGGKEGRDNLRAYTCLKA